MRRARLQEASRHILSKLGCGQMLDHAWVGEEGAVALAQQVQPRLEGEGGCQGGEAG